MTCEVEVVLGNTELQESEDDRGRELVLPHLSHSGCQRAGVDPSKERAVAMDTVVSVEMGENLTGRRGKNKGSEREKGQ